jgi:hypothetical protein
MVRQWPYNLSPDEAVVTKQKYEGAGGECDTINPLGMQNIGMPSGNCVPEAETAAIG